MLVLMSISSKHDKNSFIVLEIVIVLKTSNITILVVTLGVLFLVEIVSKEKEIYKVPQSQLNACKLALIAYGRW